MVAEHLLLPAPSGPDETACGVDQRAEIDGLPQFLLGFPAAQSAGPSPNSSPPPGSFVQSRPARNSSLSSTRVLGTIRPPSIGRSRRRSTPATLKRWMSISSHGGRVARSISRLPGGPGRRSTRNPASTSWPGGRPLWHSRSPKCRPPDSRRKASAKRSGPRVPAGCPGRRRRSRSGRTPRPGCGPGRIAATSCAAG